jgi:prepilin-type N-terminal cleavage/methylation domain-containing protein
MKGFTLLESMVVLFLFVVAIVIAAQIYVGLMSSAILAESFQLGLDNFRYGAERILNEIKSGSNFTPSLSSLEFLDRHCKKIKVFTSSTNLIFESNGIQVPLFDNELVEINSFRLYYDTPSGTDPYPYFKTASAPKFFLINYKVNLKTKITNIPLDIWQAVAPFNNVFPNNPCF